MTLRQFKLTSDEEIICEIVESEDDSSDAIIATKIFRIHSAEDYESGIRYYSFKPWLSFQDRIEDLSVISTSHIIGQTTPSESLKKHYDIAIKEVKKTEGNKRASYNFDDILEEYGDLEPEELVEVLREKYLQDNHDSDQPNVIQFDPNRRLH